MLLDVRNLEPATVTQKSCSAFPLILTKAKSSRCLAANGMGKTTTVRHIAWARTCDRGGNNIRGASAQNAALPMK